MRRVPVVIIGGFLGSGKTTLLLNMLKTARQKGKNATVLINERGKIDIDGMIVTRKSEADDVETLFDGCICCTKKSEIANSIDKLLQKNPDVILIELTGVADPEEVANTLNEREIIAKVVLKMIITIVDSEYLLNDCVSDMQNMLRSQLRMANFIVMNKTDLISESDKEKVQQIVREQNPTAIIEFAQYGRVDMEYLHKNINQSVRHLPDNGSSKEAGVFTNMTTTVLPIEEAIQKEDVEVFLKNHADTIIRAKGFVLVKEGEKECSYLFQYSGVQRMEWTEEESDRFYLIFIGVDLSARKLKEKWLSITQ